jgi:hypothetical protein
VFRFAGFDAPYPLLAITRFLSKPYLIPAKLIAALPYPLSESDWINAPHKGTYTKNLVGMIEHSFGLQITHVWVMLAHVSQSPYPRLCHRRRPKEVGRPYWHYAIAGLVLVGAV